MLTTLYKRINKYYIAPISILTGFTLWFAYDIYTFQNYFAHPDFRLYYPFRQWFSQRLLTGEQFPLWNPYWGIGQPTEIWATIPIDIYTIMEMIFGPQYHYFQTFQLILILLIGFYAFIKLGFKPLAATTGAILFFMTPWVTYFYFYFMKSNSFISLILLFTFIYLWVKTEDYKYIFFIIGTTIFSMFGTKPEFWFCQTVFCIFFSVAAGLVFYPNKLSHVIKIALIAILAVAIGILAHLWQLNILIRIMGNADRAIDASFQNLFKWEMYHNLLRSIIESVLFKMFGIGLLLYLGITLKRQFSIVFLFLGILALILIQVWHVPIVISFLKSPVFYGTMLGIILSIIFFRGITWLDYGKTAFLFLLFIYYWCRPEKGDLGEMEVIRSAPAAFKILLAGFVWLGCMQFWKNKLAKLAYFSVFFIFIMRDQGQIILAYLTGLLWIPTRDNYIIDFSVAVIAVIGLSELELSNIFIKNNNRWSKMWETASPLSIIAIAVIVFSASANFYYSHPFMQKTPPNYSNYTDIPNIRNLMKELKDSTTTRVFLAYDDMWSFTYGVGSSLIEGVGQVVQYSSFNPKRYKDWTIYKRLGVMPEQRLGGYPNEYSDKTISKLPHRNNLGYSNSEIYSYSLMLRPPTDINTLRLLGVKYIIGLSPLSEQMIRELNFEDVRERNGAAYPGRGETLSVARIINPLSRAFLVYGISQNNIDEFMNEMSPTINEHTIATKSFQLPFSPLSIEKYKPNNVSVTFEAKYESYLVLSDLYYPYWHVRIDGKEAEIIPAFYIFRAVKVPAGKHSVDFYYKIPYFTQSIAVSALIIFCSIFATSYYFKFYRYFKKEEIAKWDRDRVVKNILILFIVSVLLFTFVQLNPGSRNPNSPMALQHAQSISIAISQMKYGLTGYRGYRSVHELFYGATGQGDLGAKNHDINGWIEGALSINNVSAMGIHYSNHEIGFANYYKLAFKIFGFNIEGTTYLYFLLLGLSILIFLITFYNDITLMYILMLFVSSLYVVLTSHNVVVEGVTTQRFLPVLAILPSFYIALIALGKYNLSKPIFIFGTILQSLILIFTIHVRNSAEYQLMFLAGITLLAILWYWKKERTLKKSFKNIKFWPLILVLAFFFSQIIYVKIASDEYYNAANKKHPFMQQIYMGLLASKYQDISYFNDGVSVKLVMDKAPSYGYVFGAAQVEKFTQGLPLEQKNEIAMAGEEYDSILMQECIKMIKDEPLLLVNSLLFKLKVYFQNYISKDQGFVQNVFNIPLLLVIILNCCFVRIVLGGEWFKYIVILIISFLFALLPVLVTFPIGHSIIDSGLLLTMIIYTIFSVIIIYAINVGESYF